jgi:3-dehydroquinate synthase
MRSLEVTLPAGADRRYEILVGARLPGDAARILLEQMRAARYAVVSDDTVGPLYAEPLVEELRRRSEVVDYESFPAGEESKTRQTAARLQDRMIDAGMGRDGCVIAVGGGVVGDIAGFVAATLFRGIPHVQIPTTLLAMVDSSVGGKTGVDTPAGKNLVGAFHQPACVLIDTLTLGSLPAEELIAGFAEVIKYGVILDAELFERIEANLGDAGIAHCKSDLDEIIARCCALKAEVTATDERESDYRQILNFGHTVAHGIEASMAYSIRHGEAVAVGMVAEARLAHRLVGAPEELAVRVAALCERAGLPISLPAGCTPEDVISAAAKDKKTRVGKPRCALPADLGKMAQGPDGYGIAVEPDDLLAVLR